MTNEHAQPESDADSCELVCPRCLACLDEAPELGNCPACGIAYSKHFIRKTNYDSDCRTCGYELVGLPPKGVCPECGSPYRLLTKLQGSSQHNAPPETYTEPVLGLCAGPPLLLGIAIVMFMNNGELPALLVGGFAGVFAMIVIPSILGSRRVRNPGSSAKPGDVDGRAILEFVLVLLNIITVIVVIGSCCTPMVLLGACMA